jgi:glutamyl-tRNA synthetase/glutamyl-Q tRNA(Asp) synthetase
VVAVSCSAGFEDANLGAQTQVPSLQCGDLLLRDRLGHWTYQFAVVADDLAQQIALVVRGRDLLASTGRQLLLGELLGRAEPPVFLHHALLIHDDGSKLAKSRGSTGIAELRAAGVSAAAVLGLAAARAGLLVEPREVPVSALPELVAAVETLPGGDIRAD